MSPNHRKLGLALAPFALLLASAAASAEDTTKGAHWVTTHTARHPLADVLGAREALASGEPVHVVVSLHLRNEAALDDYLALVRKPGSPVFGSAMAPGRFTADYAPTEAQARAVADHLAASGFRNIVIAPNRLLVSADGTAGTVAGAFRATLARTLRDGRPVIANLEAPQVPAHLAGIVQSVLGLQTAYQARPMLQQARVQSAATPQAQHGFNPVVFPTIYHAGSVPNASKTVVAIIAQGSLSQTKTDLLTFESNNGITPVSVQTIKTGPSSSDTSGLLEWNLDSQSIVGMSGGKVKKLIFYDGPTLNNSDLTVELNQAVVDNLAKVINVSLGECETYTVNDGSMAADDNIFKQAVAQGQTFAVSAGDSGSNECTSTPTGTTPSYPASSPYVVALGGTTLLANADNSYASETVWSGTGGSASKVEPQPSWQNGYVPNKTKRGVADVAFDASPNTGAILVYNGGSAQVGGTSLSAPLFVGAWARIESSHNNTLGFAAPLIYAAYAASKTPFHDIVSGSNGANSAKVGWDYPTGLGSFDIQALNAGL